MTKPAQTWTGSGSDVGSALAYRAIPPTLATHAPIGAFWPGLVWCG